MFAMPWGSYPEADVQGANVPHSSQQQQQQRCRSLRISRSLTTA